MRYRLAARAQQWATAGITAFFSSRRRHTRFKCDWSSDVCSSDLGTQSTVVCVPSVCEKRINMENANRRLMWHGMFLFLLGLFTGFLEPRFANIRMGLAAHLEGVMNGTFLVALGAIWNEVPLPSPANAIAYWALLYGTYANWFVTTLAAVFGTAALSPITWAGHSGHAC